MYLTGFGKYLPERLVGNAEMAALLGVEASWIVEMSGISERRFAAVGELLVEMGVKAGLEALERSGVTAGDLGLVLVSSGSSERRFPGPASEVASRLGAVGAVAIDVPMASAGALFALAQAEVWGPRVNKVLVVAVEKMSPVVMTEPMEKGTAMLFGDGAGACVLDAEEGLMRIVDFALGSDGSAAAELRLEFGASVHMNGRMVIMHAARKVPAAIETVLRRAGISAAEIRVFLMHQANSNLIVKIAQTIGVDATRFYSNIGRYGNTSSASMLIAAREWQEESGGLKAGERAMFAAFGAGFHWGAMLVEGV